MNKKERKLKMTAEDCCQKVLIEVKLYDDEDESVTMDEFYSACMQLAYAMGYHKETIKEYFKYE